MFNLEVKEKFNALATAFLLALAGAFKSWTMLFNGFVLALPWLFDNFAVLQPYMPADLYVKIAFYLPLANFFLRMKTTKSLIAKANSPLDSLQSLRNVVPMLALGVLSLAMMLPAASYAAEPVRRMKDGRIYRSAAQLAVFKLYNPCPVTGQASGSCPGYVVDHEWPLRCARVEFERKLFDVPANMKWQTVAEARLKDKTEGAECRVPAGDAAIDGDAS